MDCERADLLIGLLGDPGDTGDSADDALTPAERAEAEAHVAACPGCGEALAAYRAIATAVRELPVEAPSAAGTARAYAAVVEAMAAAAAPPGLRVLEGGAARARKAEAPRRRPPLWLQGLAAAACVMIVVTLTLVRSDVRRDESGRVARSPQQDAAPAQREKLEPEQGRVAAPAPAPSTSPASPAPPAAAATRMPELDDAEQKAAERADTFARDAEEDRDAQAAAANEGVLADGEALGAADDREAPGDGAPKREEAASSGVRPQEPTDAPAGAVIAAWRVGDRVVVLERAGEAILAHEAPLAWLDEGDGAARRGAAAQQAPGAGGAPAPPAEAEAAEEAEVASLPTSVAERLSAERLSARTARGRAPAARAVPTNLDAHLRTILASELRQPRDPAWTTRVAALLQALGEPASDTARVSSDQLARRARRHLDVADEAESAPAGER